MAELKDFFVPVSRLSESELDFIRDIAQALASGDANGMTIQQILNQIAPIQCVNHPRGVPAPTILAHALALASSQLSLGVKESNDA